MDIKVLTVGIDPIAWDLAKKHLAEQNLIKEEPNLEKLMESPLPEPPAAVLVGPPPQGVALTELAQLLRMNYSNAGIYYMTTVREGFERKDFMKNGFSDAFLLPFDSGTFEIAFKNDIARASKGAIKVYKQVKLIDIAADTVLEFDTYISLPTNGKHIKYSAAGDPIDQGRVDNLKKKQHGGLEISNDQIKKFYEFTAKQLKSMGKSGISETEKQEKVQTAIRDIMSGLFNTANQDATIDQGKAIVGDCQGIVKAYILDGTENANWYEKLLAVQNQGEGAYSHASNVATYAALFSIGLGIGKPDQLAMAGLLHDIGLSDVPQEIQSKDPSLWTKEEAAQYQKHVEHSISIIKNRKLIMPDTVQKMILQHHERWNGTGYPKQYAGTRIMPEAQVLALADELDSMTEAAHGSVKISHAEALKKLKVMADASAAGQLFDPKLLEKLLKLFPAEVQAPVAKGA